MADDRATRERRNRYKQYYDRFHNGSRCYYCGDQKSETDHVPALSVVYKLGIEEVLKQGGKLILVESCRECNAMLGNKPLLTLDDRAKYIYKRLQSRYKRLLASEEWLDEEIDELEGYLRDYVASHSCAHSWVERRLQYMEDIFYDIL